MKILNYDEFLNENGASYSPPRTGSAPTYGSELAGSGSGSASMPEPRRGFVYYSWDDFINTDFKVYQDIFIEEEDSDYGLYEILIGESKYILKPCIVYEHKETHVHLVNLEDGEIYLTISEVIPESKELKMGEFYIDPNITEYKSIINQLIEQGFMSKRESNQIVGKGASDIYKVLGI